MKKTNEVSKELKKKIKTIEMELAVAKLFGIRTHIIVPNLSWGLVGMHECDLFILRSSGTAIEVEIKVTKADFLKDFEKKHNHVDTRHRITELYYAIPDYLVDKCIDLLPEGAGLIVCKRINYRRQTGGFMEVRAEYHTKAKRIKNSRKLTTEEQLKVSRLGVMRIWGLKEKVIKLQSK